MIFYIQVRTTGRNASRCQARTYVGSHRCDYKGKLRENSIRMCTRHWNMFKQNPVVEEWE